jgi:hypothetical protein
MKSYYDLARDNMETARQEYENGLKKHRNQEAMKAWLNLNVALFKMAVGIAAEDPAMIAESIGQYCVVLHFFLQH